MLAAAVFWVDARRQRRRKRERRSGTVYASLLARGERREAGGPEHSRSDRDDVIAHRADPNACSIVGNAVLRRLDVEHVLIAVGAAQRVGVTAGVDEHRLGALGVQRAQMQGGFVFGALLGR